MASDLDTAVRKEIEAYAKANFAAVPLQFEGQKFEPSTDEWARLTVRFGDAFEDAMGPDGSGGDTVVGVVLFDVFYRPSKGTGPLLRRADAARDLFNRKDLAGIRFGPTSGPGPARDDREGWLMVTLTTPFEVDETV